MNRILADRGPVLIAVAWVFAAAPAARADAPPAPSSNPSPTFSCPFHDHGTSVTSESHGSSSSSSSSDDDDDGDYDADDGYASTSDDLHGPGTGRAVSWPSEVGARLEGAYGSVDFADGGFTDPNDTVHIPGAALEIGRAALAGGELDLDLALTNAVRLTGGFGAYAPVGGRTGGDLSPAAFGLDARTSGLRVLTLFGEGGFVHRFGAITSYAVVHAGVMQASVQFDAACGCHGTLTATRIVLGPRLGLRAHLFSNVYLQGSLFADALRFPDYVASFGIGFGQRVR